MFLNLRINMLDLLIALSKGIDLVSPELAGHHRRVAYIALRLAREAGLSKEGQSEVFVAGLVHDSGALEDTKNLVDFEASSIHLQGHAEVGFHLLKDFQPLAQVAKIVRHHHAHWAETRSEDIPLASHIVHLADRIAILVDYDQCVLSQVPSILKRISDHEGGRFMPELVQVFRHMARKEVFWLYLKNIDSFFSRVDPESSYNIELNNEQLLALSDLFRVIIDFRCQFTSSHSYCVGEIAETLAAYNGYSENELAIMRVAGNLHDIGKLIVPLDILNKDGKLDPAERLLMNTHAFHTADILGQIKSLGPLHDWAAFHHERLDGNGYPFHLSGAQLPLGSRIMAVADIFTALVEDRPYRKGLDLEEARSIMLNLSDEGGIDARLVGLLFSHSTEVFDRLVKARELTDTKYREFRLMINATKAALDPQASAQPLEPRYG